MKTFSLIKNDIISTCIGFVVYTNHKNPNSTVKITINKHGDYAFKNDTNILQTENLAQLFAEKHQTKYRTVLVVRPYYSEKHTRKYTLK